jgi:hypothetical protein
MLALLVQKYEYLAQDRARTALEHTARAGRRLCQHTSARQHTSAYVSIRQHMSIYVSIRQHASAYGSVRENTLAYAYGETEATHRYTASKASRRLCMRCQHTSAYVCMHALLRQSWFFLCW